MLAYSLISELRDLHGKTLVCHVLCLAVAYTFLTAVQLGGETLNQQLCVGVGEYRLIITNKSTNWYHLSLAEGEFSEQTIY
jgi:hypothetical protein